MRRTGAGGGRSFVPLFAWSRTIFPELENSFVTPKGDRVVQG